MVNIDLKLDTWKNKLLDMGKRNRLLNYRDTRRSNLRIIVPGIYDLWNSFVTNEQPLKFPRVDEDENQQLSLEEKQLPATDPNSVQTNQSPKEQQRTLRNLRSKAKTFMEEQGVNVLYLSFGFLRWTESDHSKVHFDHLPLIPSFLMRHPRSAQRTLLVPSCEGSRSLLPVTASNSRPQTSSLPQYLTATLMGMLGTRMNTMTAVLMSPFWMKRPCSLSVPCYGITGAATSI